MNTREQVIQEKFDKLMVDKLVNRGWKKADKQSTTSPSLAFNVAGETVHLHPPLGMGGFAIMETAENVWAEAWDEANRPSLV